MATHRIDPEHFEHSRQAAVDRSGASDLHGVAEIDWIVDQVASIYATPLAALSIIDRHRQVLVSRVGMRVRDTPREDAFCAVAIHTPGEALVIPDAQQHPRFKSYQVVKEDPHVRFYAGMPIVSRDGYALGALCVADTKARSMRVDTTQLMIFAHQIERLLWR